jgi:hypothetical protein
VSVSPRTKLQTLYLRNSNHRWKFDTTDSEFKVCNFRNACLLYGKFPTFVYFIDPVINDLLPEEFKFSEFTSQEHLESGYTRNLSRSFMPIHYIYQAAPQHTFFHSETNYVAFLTSHSYANYGHYLVDIILATFAAAMHYRIY